MALLDGYLDARDWLAEKFEAVTTEMHVIRPSEWAEQKRYLSQAESSIPGPYRFSVTPFLREIVDCLSADSPVRFVAFMKGVQIGATAGVLENAIGYWIDHIGHAPIMMVTADDALAKLRLDGHVIPMLQSSGLASLIQSADETNTRKTGATEKKIEFAGGGFLIPFGAQSANKLRSIPIRVLLRDEVDGWPAEVGRQGDPMKLSESRTKTYERNRKILDISTPLLKGQSNIEKQFKLGDRRYYHVRCLVCEHPQVLRWREEDSKTGEVSGIVWQTEDGKLIPDSVRYLCQRCGHAHTNDDKRKMMAPENGAQWAPTAVPISPAHRSYHLSALYSPVQTWAECVMDWLAAWDVANNRAKDMQKLQVFFNNILGKTFEVRGDKLRYETVSSHRRSAYRFGEVPNTFAVRHCGSRVLLLVCTVDVHGDNLKAAVWGWCRDRRVVLVDYFTFEGDTEQLDNEATWGELRKLVESKTYTADDGVSYSIPITLVDSGYRPDTVYRFCAEYEAGVFPVKGMPAPPRHARFKEFSEFTSEMGTRGFGIVVDPYKDRWSASLKNSWDTHAQQPEGHFNAPADALDAQLKELTIETKREKIDARTGQRVGWEWHRPSGAKNELWDLLVYANAALDIVAANVMIEELEHEAVDWGKFYDLIEVEERFFRTTRPTV
jgi:phage terminase large subunit GpA-like protein